MKHPIKNFTLSNLENWLEHHDHPRYRARQIWHWLFEKWVGDFDSMANIPAALREALDESFLPTSVHEKTRLKSTDGTEK